MSVDNISGPSHKPSDHVSSCSFEEMLRAADDEEGLLSRAAGGLANGGGGGASGVVKTLLRRPRVFILGVVWETPQVRSPLQHTMSRSASVVAGLQRHAGLHMHLYSSISPAALLEKLL
jgi:hypothetical protein